MAAISEFSFTMVLHGGTGYVVTMRAGTNFTADEDADEFADMDPDDTIMEWLVYLDRQYLGKAQGTMVEAMRMSFEYAIEFLGRPQPYLQAEQEMRLDGPDIPDEDEPPLIESLFV